MKANELMIGDWVMFEGKPDKITEISIELDKTTFLVESCDNALFEDNIEPVVLTKDIIDASGLILGSIELPEPIVSRLHDPTLININKIAFDFSVLHDSSRVRTAYHVDIRHRETRMFYGGNLHIKIEYVHQLQHAFRLFGLNSIADNIKVKL